MRSSSAGSRRSEKPCSIVSTPSSIASRAPSRPSACAATRRPSRWASSTSAASSSRVSWAGSGSSRSTERAPVAITLMKSAPRRSWARTAWRRAHGPSASWYIVPNMRPPGDVAETIRAHERIRGPSTRPSSTRAPHHDGLVVVRADVADRRHSAAEQRPARARQQEVAELARAGILALERLRRAEAGRAGRVRDQVRVTVDEARHDGQAAAVVGAFRSLAAHLAELRDAAVLERDRRVLEHGARARVDRPHAPDPLHLEPPLPGEASA